MDPTVPSIEIAQHAHAFSIRRPDGKMDARARTEGDPMRAEFVERARVRTLAEQVQIELGQHPSVSVRIVDLAYLAIMEGDAKTVGHVGDVGTLRYLEETSWMTSLHFHSPRACYQLDAARRRLQRSHDTLRAIVERDRMRAEQPERIAARRADKRGDLRFVQGAGARDCH